MVSPHVIYVDRSKVNLEKSKISLEQQSLDLQRNVYTAFADAKGAFEII
jgi:outer membrane protein